MAVIVIGSLLVILSLVNLINLIEVRRGLKRIRNTFSKRLEDEALPDIAVSIRTIAFHQSEVVKTHVAALEAKPGSSSAVPPISYPMSKAMRVLEPDFVTTGSSGLAICSVALGEAYRQRIRPCLDSHRCFAERHNLTNVVLLKAPTYLERPAAWMKVPLLMQLAERGFRYILWVDADAMITDHDHDVSAQIAILEEQDKSILMTEDEAGINSGVMFARNGPRLRHILDLVWLFNADILNDVWEQNALQYLMSVFPAVANEIVIDSTPKNFNSFPRERNLFHPTAERSIWSRGDFICHFSGIRSPHLERYISDYSSALQAS